MISEDGKQVHITRVTESLSVRIACHSLQASVPKSPHITGKRYGKLIP